MDHVFHFERQWLISWVKMNNAMLFKEQLNNKTAQILKKPFLEGKKFSQNSKSSINQKISQFYTLSA
jgi:hypothetical protein